MDRFKDIVFFPIVAILSLCAMPLGASAKVEVRVYLMRGFLEVSTGLDDLEVKLKRRGIAAETTSYLAGSFVASAAMQSYRAKPGTKIVLIGHSLGANAAIEVAKTLQGAKVPVALIAVFSPANENAVPGNVAQAVNYYQSNSLTFNTPYSRSADFRGQLRNVDLARNPNVHHFNIEKLDTLHAEIIRIVLGLSGEKSENSAAIPAARARTPSN